MKPKLIALINVLYVAGLLALYRGIGTIPDGFVLLLPFVLVSPLILALNVMFLIRVVRSKQFSVQTKLAIIAMLAGSVLAGFVLWQVFLVASKAIRQNQDYNNSAYGQHDKDFQNCLKSAKYGDAKDYEKTRQDCLQTHPPGIWAN